MIFPGALRRSYDFTRVFGRTFSFYTKFDRDAMTHKPIPDYGLNLRFSMNSFQLVWAPEDTDGHCKLYFKNVINIFY